MAEISRIDEKGSTIMPSKDRLGVEKGDYLKWEIRKGYAIVKVVKNPYRFLKGRHRDPKLTYDKVEGLADELLEDRTNADNRTRHAYSLC